MKLNNLHLIYLYFGITIIILSFSGLLYFYHNNNLLASISLGLTWLGILFVIDYFLAKKFHVHYLPVRLKDVHKFLLLSLLSIIFCLILEFACLYTTRLWYYPYAPFYVYFWIAPFFYVLYTLVLFELYEFVKHSFNHYKKSLKVSIKTYNRIMQTELLVGMVTTWIWVTFSLNNISKFKIPVWEVSLDSGISVPGWFGFTVLLSMFCCFEYLAFLRQRHTLTYDILKGDLRPILTVLIANILAILLIEMVNAPFQLWIFSNWFLQNTKVMTLPILVLILWPGQFFIFLSLFSAFLDKKKAEIW